MHHKYTLRTRMADLINNDPQLLSTLTRFGIALGFGEKSVGEVCVANKIDTATFLAVVNFLAEESVEINESPENISLETVVNFLKNAHSYFLSYKLPAIRERLYEIVSADDVNHSYRVVLLKFFDEYVEEVKKHMEYEDRTVFPYVLQLRNGVKAPGYRIADFEEHHTDVDSKIIELKSILIKYHPAGSVNYKLNEILFELLACERDLATHNMVEDFLLVPLVEVVENKLLKNN